MVHVDLVYRLEVDCAAQLGLVLVQVVAERALGPVEHEPALVPRPELLAHLEQVAAARVRVENHERLTCARIELIDELVAAVVNMLLQVKVALSHGQVAGQRSSLFYFKNYS